ncbi:unnamed protein product [Thelazia callipaeda]|uniref:CX domain-containing protein n=1 Tax=Thelazia callipaeda TaxID=103827 RepID=A0A0N5DB62_THECL|nr:unnamed protein product [Thelazia callipaeda]
MKRQRYFRLQLYLLLVLFLVNECGCKRGSVFTGSRGTSGSRLGNLRSKMGGMFSGSRGTYGSNRGGYGSNNYGRSSGGGFWGTRSNAGRVKSGWGSSARGTSWGQPRGRGLFTKSNIGSFVAGAAAGYLTYKAGKALIRSAYAPMMWNNRPYYWGSNYYRGGGYGTHMCHMPVDSNDEHLGKVYFQDGSRPKELVWSCSYDEYCCGYDCCLRGGASGYSGFNLGYSLVIAASTAYCLRNY